MSDRKRTAAICAAVLGAVVTPLAGTARATTYTWQGNLQQDAANPAGTAAAFNWDANNVSNGATVTNWAGGVVPVAGVDTQLVFSSAAAAQDATHTVNESPRQNIAANGFGLNAVTFGGDAFTLNGGPLIFSNSSSGAAATIAQNSAASQTINESVLLQSDLVLGGTGTGTVTLTSVLAQIGSGTPRAVTLAAGTYVLAGQDNFAGGVTLKAGTLSLASAGALGSTGTITGGNGVLQFTAANTTDYSARLSTAAGQAFRFDTNGQAVTFANGPSGVGTSLSKSGAGTLTLNGTTTVSSGLGAYVGTLAVGPNATVTANQITVGSAAGGLFTQAAGSTVTAPTVTLTTLAGETGTYNLAGGTLATNTVSLGKGTGVLNLDGGTLRVTSDTRQIFSRLTAINVLGGGVTVDTAGHQVIFTQPLSHAGTAATDGGLTKVGAGSLFLFSPNAYTGPTVVAAGTLRTQTTTAATGGGPIEVQAGATLGGSGPLGTGTVTVGRGATITGGAADTLIGTLTTGAEAWSAGGQFVVKVTTSGNDQLVMSGLAVAAVAGDPFTIAVTGPGSAAPATGPTYVVARDTEADDTNPFAPANAAATIARLVLTTSGVASSTGSFTLATQADSAGGYDLVVTAAPEPTSLLLVGVAVGPLVLGRRQRPSRCSRR